MPFYLSHGGCDVFHVIGRAEEDVLGNVYSLLSCSVRDGCGQPPEIIRTLTHQMLYSRLVGHRGSKCAVDRRPFRLNQIDETVERETAATVRPVAHREHVHSMRTNAWVHCQRLQAVNLFQQASQQIKVC